MNITFKEVDKSKINDFRYIAKWSNDPEIKYFIQVNFEEKDLPDIEAEELFNNAKDNDSKYIYFVIVDEKPVGDISIMIDPSHLHKKEKDTGWISICIGEKEYRKKGIGKIGMSFLEEQCKKLKLNRIELGVFEHNKRAIAFYEKLGYKKIATIKKFTYCNGKWQDDYRMEKYL